jgi:hypothetical protein
MFDNLNPFRGNGAYLIKTVGGIEPLYRSGQRDKILIVIGRIDIVRGFQREQQGISRGRISR